MILAETSIKRPVLTIMMSLGLILFGVVGLLRLPVRELPDIDPPIVNVMTTYPGANASVVETEVTERLEEAINSIEGIKTLTSESREQVSSITVEFDLSRNIDAATQDVRDRVARVRGLLPDDVKEPVIAKQEADAAPVIVVALFSDRLSTLDLSQLAEDTLKDRFQTIRGVSSVFIGGQKRFAIRLWLDSEKMAARRVSALDVQRALRQQNVELPSGRVENLDREMTIQTLGEMKTAEEFNQLVIREEGATLIRLQDIGRAEVGVQDERAIARFNSKPAVGLLIVKQSKANTIEVADAVRRELEQLKPILPAGVETFLAYDESIYVKEAIREVWNTLGIAFALVVLTIFIFLRNVRSTLIPSITIPVSIVATYGVLYIMGYSVNILTMMALVLAIGIVVDDSIVVLENIYRHIEMGKPPLEAAFVAMREIGFAIIAITLSLVAVFLPLAFQTSVTGRLFIEFAIALCGSVLISAFVALSLTPMISARILKPHGAVHHGRIFNFFERGFEWLTGHYRKMLLWALRHRPAMVVISLATLGLAAFFFLRLDQEFMPEEDKGRMLCFAITPEGSTTEYTARMVYKMEDIVRGTPEVLGYFSAVALAREGPGKANEGLMFLRLKDERTRRLQDVMGGPTGIGARFFGEVEGALAIPIAPKAVGRSWSQPFQLVLQYHDLNRLNEFANQYANQLRGTGALANVRCTFELTKPELRIHIDRNRAAALGVSIEDISRSLQILFGGLDLSKVKLRGKEYDVIAQLERASRLTPDALDRLYVRGAQNTLIQLSNLVHYETGAGPNAIRHYARFRSATIEATPVGVPLGAAMSQAEKILQRDLPDGFRYRWDGECRDLKESGQEMLFVLILAITIIYMVLAAQFESLLHPLTVMLALPLAAVGALGALWLLSYVNLLGTMFYGMAHYAPNPPSFAHWLSAIIPRIPAMNINLFSQVGLVLLAGLVTKNSILLVEFANQQMAAGRSARDAMIESGLIRLRPILMTSVSTIAGILPIAIGFGVGAESRRPMGVAAVGGMITSTFLTLLVVPVVYTLFNDLAAWFHRKREGKHPPEKPHASGNPEKKAD
jgi:hydrophobe/amphiphile efflux-1 (HAE1) family protein